MSTTTDTTTAHRTHTSGYGVSFHDVAHAVPDLPGYAAAGVIPDAPELTKAIARHTELVNGYREAMVDRDAAAAIVRNAPADTLAITRAIREGTDPAEAADHAAAERAKTQRDLDRATAIIAGFSTPLLESAWTVMGLVEEHAPAALAQLAEHTARQEAAVDRARAALAKTEAALRETTALASWIENTRQIRNTGFPPARDIALAG